MLFCVNKLFYPTDKELNFVTKEPRAKLINTIEAYQDPILDIVHSYHIEQLVFSTLNITQTG